MFGYTAKQTLEVAQKLYEIQALTYPRTDSRFITEDMAGGIATLVSSVHAMLPLKIDFETDIGSTNTTNIVNSSKVTDHHAILPTPGAASVDMSTLSTAEKNILLMVCVRLLAAVAKKHLYAETAVAVVCEGEIFTAKGKTVKQNGWKAIEQAFAISCGKPKKGNDSGDGGLPELTEGQQYTAKSSVREGFTQPPRHYTEDTLLSAMESAGAEDMPEDAERKGIGTPATRADTIETLVKREYIVRKDKQLLPTDKGLSLIKVLPDHDPIKSPILTAEWESDLKKVERNEMTADAFMDAIGRYVGDAVTKTKDGGTVTDEHRALFPQTKRGGGEVVGKCPRCGGDVSENPKAFSCANTRDKKCGFALFKDNRYFTAKKKTITKSIAKALLTDGRIFLKDLHSEKTGKDYAATIILDDKGEGYARFLMEFEKH
jgi:DNA topoisomerase-3